MDIKDILHNYATKAYPEADIDRGFVEWEYPKIREHGDISTNIPLKLCKRLKKKPLEIAETFSKLLDEDIKSGRLKSFGGVEVKAPGFVNFWFSDEYLAENIAEILRQGEVYGQKPTAAGAKINFEFVSANPTGPLTIAHGRQAVCGDVICNIMAYRGIDVAREYYMNDVGNQIDLLGKSLECRYREYCGDKNAVLPEGGYKGDYVLAMADKFKEQNGDKYYSDKAGEHADKFKCFALAEMEERVLDELDRFRVRFTRSGKNSNVISQKTHVMDSGAVEKTLAELKSSGYIFEKDGALWLRTTDFGDDKDRVLRKSDGSYTYFAPDIAYHRDKFARGFARLINIWGPDHHGYIPRMRAAIQMLGHPPESLEVLIIQLATLYRGTEKIRMSTREGEYVTLTQVMDEIGVDAARFFFLMRNTDSHLEFDLELAKQKTLDNPLYYIQYAHARICSILKNAAANGLDVGGDSAEGMCFTQQEEKNIANTLFRFTSILDSSTKDLEPNRLVNYLTSLASEFHSFYAKHKVISPDPQTAATRILLIRAINTILDLGLEKLLGVNAPETM